MPLMFSVGCDAVDDRFFLIGPAAAPERSWFGPQSISMYFHCVSYVAIRVDYV